MWLEYNINFVNLRFITSGGNHQLIYRIRARSLRPRPRVSGYFWIRYESEIEWTLNPDLKSGYFFIWWRNKIEPSALPTTVSTLEPFCPWRTGVEIVPTKAEQDTNFAPFTTHALFPIFPEESWVLEWILIRVNRQIRFAYGYVLLSIQKYLDTCGRCLRRPRSYPTTATKTSLKKWMLTL